MPRIMTRYGQPTECGQSEWPPVELRKARALQVQDAMFHFLETDRPGLRSGYALNLAAQCLAALEVLVLLWPWAQVDHPHRVVHRGYDQDC